MTFAIWQGDFKQKGRAATTLAGCRRCQSMKSTQRAVHEPLGPTPEPPRPRATPPPARPWFSRWFVTKPAQPAPPAEDVDSLFAFPSEGVTGPELVAKPHRLKPEPPAPRTDQWKTLVRPAAIVLGVGIVVALSVLAVRRFPLQPAAASQPQSGRLTIETRPGNLEVTIDGDKRGKSPVTVSLAPGPHTVTIHGGVDDRVVPLTLAAGADVTQYFEMKTPEPGATLGRLSIVTDPPGARVSVDGKPQGNSPITIEELTAASHKITATNEAGAVERLVAVPAGGTASVMFSLPRLSGPVGGWLAIAAPFDVEVVERDDVIGASGTNKVMLAAGRHEITLASRNLGYREARTIDITAGKTVTLRVDPPKAAVSVNARPWADVTFDGNSLGQTPIANLLMTIGSHDVVFRHPQFGERRQTVVVTSTGPNRIAVDLTK
jgi:hypothetical protein